MEHRERKRIRLKEYDYSSNGAYFITICTSNRRCLLGEIVGADDPVRPDSIKLSSIGYIVLDCWNTINETYMNIQTDKFVIMPNHIHGIITINNNEMGVFSDNCISFTQYTQAHPDNKGITEGGQSRPPLQKVIQGFKSLSTRRCFQCGYKTIWQRSYYEHIIRNEQEYMEIWNYIDTNPRKWQEDKYYNNHSF